MSDVDRFPELSEGLYKPDFELLDRYQTFSSEILRLSLLGITAIGFLLSLDEKSIGQKRLAAVLSNPGLRHILIASVILLGGASAFALVHRWVSSDSMYFQLKIYRGSKNPEDARRRDRLFDISSWSILLAPFFLGLAVITLGLAFLVALI